MNIHTLYTNNCDEDNYNVQYLNIKNKEVDVAYLLCVIIFRRHI